MTAVASVSSASTYQRRLALAEEADQRKTRIVIDNMRDGFTIDWTRVLTVDSPEPLPIIERNLHEELRRERFTQTVALLGMNAKCLASLIHHQTEVLAGVKAEVILAPLQFSAEPSLGNEEDALAYWRRVLNLTDRQAAEVEQWLRGFESRAREMRDAVDEALSSRLAELFSRAITGDKGVQGFIKEARDVLPDESRALLENQYRTHLTRVYAADQEAMFVSRSNAFPFVQFMNPRDTRTTWWICKPMATSGPGGHGYICATTDPLVRKWRAPNHYQCRSMWSPIGYRECQRIGILAQDGKTKFAIQGNNPDRPFGDPIALVQNPNPPHEMRRVEPAEGFEGNA